MRVNQGVILIGGRGTRLGALTTNFAKPMLEVAGRPFVEHVVSHLARYGVRDVVLLAGHSGALPRERYHGRKLFGADISVLVEPEPLGTGGALRFAADRLDETFLLTNGDTFFDADLLPLISMTTQPQWSAAMLLRRPPAGARYGCVDLMPDGTIRAFTEKPPNTSGSALVNAGTYLMRRDSVLAAIDKMPWSLEQTVFPALGARGMLRGVEADGYFIDIGVPDSLAAAQRELASQRTRPAAFLDRDGVLNVDRGYTHRPEQLEWIAGAPDVTRRLNHAGYYVFVVTNQAGIARGYYDEAAVHRFHDAMQDRLMERGAHIDAFYHCPHHPEGTVRDLAIRCGCRKPNPGMLESAAAEWFIDRQRSFLIGDKDDDVAAARAFGIRGLKFEPDQVTLEGLLDKLLATDSQTVHVQSG